MAPQPYVPVQLTDEQQALAEQAVEVGRGLTEQLGHLKACGGNCDALLQQVHDTHAKLLTMLNHFGRRKEQQR